DKLQKQIISDIQTNIHHKPVKALQSQSPFKSPAQEAIFFAALNEIQAANLIPLGFGIKPSEWEDGEYPTYECTMFGCCKKEITVLVVIWLPHAIAWCQALYCMQMFISQFSNEQL
ncbi:hypothetical protein K439DRAFT_1353650, partial [Ramaria rubella]